MRYIYSRIIISTCWRFCEWFIFLEEDNKMNKMCKIFAVLSIFLFTITVVLYAYNATATLQ